MKIVGYSERGLINSLLYEINFSNNSLQIINELLNAITFPLLSVKFNISEIEILIEQSFSDFGTVDFLFLVNNSGSKQSIFFEAKIVNYSDIFSEFEKFNSFINGLRQSTSNLFFQIYEKIRLSAEIKNNNFIALHDGIKFPACSRKILRKIGTRKVVLKATNELAKFTDTSYFILLVPDDLSSLKNFFEKKLTDFQPKDFVGWDIKNLGYLNWAKIETICSKYNLEITLKNFDWNKGIIYK